MCICLNIKKKRKHPVWSLHMVGIPVVDVNDYTAWFESIPASSESRFCPAQTWPYGFTSIL